MSDARVVGHEGVMIPVIRASDNTAIDGEVIKVYGGMASGRKARGLPDWCHIREVGVGLFESLEL